MLLNASSRNACLTESSTPCGSSDQAWLSSDARVHFNVDGDDFFVDLLFFHVAQLRYVVIELKVCKFEPRDAGQIGFYVALVDDRLRTTTKHQRTIGILLVANKNDTVVRYALAGAAQPVAVSRYELTPETQSALPDEKTITRAFEDQLVLEAVTDDDDGTEDKRQ